MSDLIVLSVASEIYPLVKTGGLADVVGALPQALAAEGIAVTTLVPGYPPVLRALKNTESVHRFAGFFGGEARLLRGRSGALDLFVLDAPHLFRRDGTPYASADGRDWTDNALRFAALSRAAADVAGGAVPRFVPHVVHAHDWQAGLVPVYLGETAQPRPRTVFTVHNLAFQGKFDAAILPSLGLPPASFTVDGVEYYGSVGYLKAGIQFADRITTVSPTYAEEILTDEGGMGLEGLLRKRASGLSGILNGVDETVWNPATDPLIAANYDARNLGPRAANTRALQAKLGLEQDSRALLFGVVSRLTWQKGLDLLLDALPALLECGGQLALLGSGDADLELRFAAAARRSPERISCTFGYDEELAHRIQAGAAALLVPSRFEPCGLTQLCGLRYGAVPVVARVGGLVDTVIDANEMALASGVGTGIQFSPVRREALEHAIVRTAHAFADRAAWLRLRRNGMRTDVSWRRPAQHYARLYREA